MNKEQRKLLEKLASHIEDVIADLEMIRDEEQEKVDNAPENLQYSERYEQMQEIADTIQSVIDELDNAVDELRTDVIDV